MHAHILQHVPFEGPGSIGDWLAGNAARVSSTRFFEAAQLPPPAGIDLIIALGGPMSVNDETQFPWLQDEKRFLAEAITGGKAVLGICLGAQLIASALGARVYPGAGKEIGWFPISAEPAAAGCFAFPARTDVFHWHGETFDLPAGAVRLASSAACRNQAFQIGARVIGLQFHLETTPGSAAALIDHCVDELVPGRYIQPEAALRNVAHADYARINALMCAVLGYLVRQ